MHVCVLGAGIVGLASAYALSLKGHTVTVIDKAGAGSGASGGNGGQLSYSYVQPLADPAIWRQLPKLLFSPSSPFKLTPQFDTCQWLWGIKFLQACNASTSCRTTAELLALAGQSRQAFDQMMAREQLDCDFAASGKLVLYDNASALAAAVSQMHLQRKMGCLQEAVTADRCVELEPALAHQHARIAGAIYTPGECAADCQKTCDGLVGVLRARGVRLLLNTRIDQLVMRGRLLAAVDTPAGAVEADHFVMALGAASAPLLRSLGMRLPVYPLKGYSITLDVSSNASAAPRVSVTDSARKVVFARMGSRLRVAGMAELSGYDTALSPRQIASLRASTESVFPGCCGIAALNPWAGLRPATPTGLPLVGLQPGGPSNLMLNTGHGALGFTLAFGSAERVAELLN